MAPLKDRNINVIRGQTGSSKIALLFHASLNQRPGRDLEIHLSMLSKQTLAIPDNHTDAIFKAPLRSSLILSSDSFQCNNAGCQNSLPDGKLNSSC